MDLEELRSFLTVVERGSFLSAAESLGMSRTTLRRRVDALSARAGVPLLESSQQGVVLTPAGEMLARRGKLMVQEASALLASIREVGHEPSGLLRVMLPVGLPPFVLTPMFAALRSAYPKLRVHCRFFDDPLSELLVDVDLIVHFSENVPKGPWCSYELLRVREWLLASRSYLEQRGTPGSIEELSGHELLAWQAPGTDGHIWPAMDGTTFQVEPSLIATDIHFVRQCCIAGLGIALVPDAMWVDPDVDTGTLVPVLEHLVGTKRKVRVTIPEALSELPKLKMVLGRIRGFVKAL